MSNVIGQTTTATSDDSIVRSGVPCETLALIGHWVRMDTNDIAVRALADTVINSNVIGIIEAKAGANICDIRLVGVSSLVFSGLDVTKTYFLSALVAGEMSTTPPGPEVSGGILMPLGTPFNSKSFEVNKGNRLKRAV